MKPRLRLAQSGLKPLLQVFVERRMRECDDVAIVGAALAAIEICPIGAETPPTDLRTTVVSR